MSGQAAQRPAEIRRSTDTSSVEPKARGNRDRSNRATKAQTRSAAESEMSIEIYSAARRLARRKFRRSCVPLFAMVFRVCDCSVAGRHRRQILSG